MLITVKVMYEKRVLVGGVSHTKNKNKTSPISPTPPSKLKVAVRTKTFFDESLPFFEYSMIKHMMKMVYKTKTNDSWSKIKEGFKSVKMKVIKTIVYLSLGDFKK